MFSRWQTLQNRQTGRRSIPVEYSMNEDQLDIWISAHKEKTLLSVQKNQSLLFTIVFCRKSIYLIWLSWYSCFTFVKNTFAAVDAVYFLIQLFGNMFTAVDIDSAYFLWINKCQNVCKLNLQKNKALLSSSGYSICCDFSSRSQKDKENNKQFAIHLLVSYKDIYKDSPRYCFNLFQSCVVQTPEVWSCYNFCRFV